MQLDTSTLPLTAHSADLIAVGRRPDGSFTAELGVLEAPLTAALAQAKHRGDVAELSLWPTLGLVSAAQVAIVGVGDASPDALRRAAGAIGHAARGAGADAVALALGALDDVSEVAVLEGFNAGKYRYNEHLSGPQTAEPSRLTLVSDPALELAGALPFAQAIDAGQSLARDLVNAPAAVIFPESLAAVAMGLVAEGIEVEVWDEQKIRAEGMGGITAVGQGSSRPPRFIHMTYRPAGAPRKKLGIIGKGVTFDAGGLSIKTADGMMTMRCDMAGSAAVIGVMKAIAALKPDVEVHGIIGAAENMLGGDAYKLGDVLRMHNGKTVEIHNTDAEGRLVLGDCLSYASALGLDAMVDIATLTGACVVALGDLYSALFSHDNSVADGILASAQQSGELVWRMPLEVAYKERLKTDFADLKNVGGPPGGSITAALFLSEFVGSTPWAHLDIAGPAFFAKKTRHFVSGGTGCMVPTLTRWILA